AADCPATATAPATQVNHTGTLKCLKCFMFAPHIPRPARLRNGRRVVYANELRTNRPPGSLPRPFMSETGGAMKPLGSFLRYLLNINTIWAVMILTGFVLCVVQHYLP